MLSLWTELTILTIWLYGQYWGWFCLPCELWLGESWLKTTITDLDDYAGYPDFADYAEFVNWADYSDYFDYNENI